MNREIILMRHGQPALATLNKVSALEMKAWIDTAHERAKVAAARLQSLATKGPVLLLGHGLMNRMIAKHLLKEGWVREKANGNRYWSAAVYRCSTT